VLKLFNATWSKDGIRLSDPFTRPFPSSPSVFKRIAQLSSAYPGTLIRAQWGFILLSAQRPQGHAGEHGKSAVEIGAENMLKDIGNDDGVVSAVEPWSRRPRWSRQVCPSAVSL